MYTIYCQVLDINEQPVEILYRKVESAHHAAAMARSLAACGVDNVRIEETI